MAKRQVEVFTAGCPVCEPAVRMVQELACPDCEITVHDVRQAGADLAASYAVKAMPAIVVDGSLVGCCQNTGPVPAQLQSAGIGVPLS